MALIHPSCRLVHHHYPRTSGTNVRRTILGKCAEWPTSHASIETYLKAVKFKEGQTDLERIGRITLPDYLWIGIARDPYEVVVSQYETIISIPANCTISRMTFKEYLVSGFIKKEIPFSHFAGFEYLNYTDHWALKKHADRIRIFKFESSYDWVELCKFIGAAVVPRPHWGAAPGRKPKEEYYSRETADLVTKIFEPDLERFKYTRFVA